MSTTSENKRQIEKTIFKSFEDIHSDEVREGVKEIDPKDREESVKASGGVMVRVKLFEESYLCVLEEALNNYIKEKAIGKNQIIDIIYNRVLMEPLELLYSAMLVYEYRELDNEV